MRTPVTTRLSSRFRGKMTSLVLAVVLLLSAFTLHSVAADSRVPLTDPIPEQIGGRGLYLKLHRVSVSIDNQLAVTRIEQVFVNEGAGVAEGTYLFPLPPGAAVSDLTLFIDGVPYKGRILDAQQAQRIYAEIVRRQRDPVLLQYVGRGAIQANIFPIPAGQERKIEIVYSHILSADNGLLNYTYPLKTDYASKLPVEQVAISVEVKSRDPISTVYSPNPFVSISRIDDNSFRAGFEASNYRAADDFSLFYGVASKEINANLLTYRAGANEDGFFMLMITPPGRIAAERAVAKDVIIVLDQSGSMQGQKWDQARAAATYVLKNLNPQDRFNAIVFSTGYRVYARSLQPVSAATGAIQWIAGLEAVGGTDINAALTAALAFADKERQTIVLFLTDGLPTEGVTDARSILENVRRAATPNTRIFAFGVGDDVDTFLLDSLTSGYGGTSVYVRPAENIEQKVSSLYNKITAPVLTALKLDVDGPMLEDMYPSAPLPDLFAGSQLIITGRYRGEGAATITLRGMLNGREQTFVYSGLNFAGIAGGQPFIPRLWATRKVGALLNQIRLNGETPELVDSVMRLSVRYGIITPYTSFLIQEHDLSRPGGEGTVPPPGLIPPPIVVTPVPMYSSAPGRGGGTSPATAAPPSNTGAAAIEKAREANDMAGANQVAAYPTAAAVGAPPSGGQPALSGSASPGEVIKQVNDRTFVWRSGVWVDTLYTSDQIKLLPVVFLSDDYFKLLEAHPEIKDYLALGEHVVIVIDGTAYEIRPG